MSRLEFAPQPKEMEVTDIATGHFVFAPVAGKEVSYSALDEAIENAGYEIDSAALTVAGTVTDERHLTTPEGQVFHLTAGDEGGKRRLAMLKPGEEVTVRGAWQTVEGVDVVAVGELKQSAEGTR